jgi:hypothetical protein
MLPPFSKRMLPYDEFISFCNEVARNHPSEIPSTFKLDLFGGITCSSK